MNHIQHVNLIVDDLDAAVAFYETILGFQKCETPEFDFPAQFVAIGDEHEIHINELQDVKPALAHFCVRLDDFSGVFHRAREAGVLDIEAFGAVRRLPTGVVQAFVRDPAGNLVEISCDAEQEVDPTILQ
jgi:catechol 2,3-dioxygenase-like lactoylglutathione lyase family enzyme